MDHKEKSADAHPFLNRKRLLVYPYLFLIAQLLIAMLNFALRDGWSGGIGGIFSFDFLVFYSSGVLYRQDITHLYDINTLATLENALLNPTSLDGGFNVNSYPPYVALLTSILTYIPYVWAYLIWTGLSLLAIFAASRWMVNRLLPMTNSMTGMTSKQMLVILLSSFPVLSGLQVGQNNAFTLMLITGILITFLERKPILAGLMAGFLIYKPQFVLGFLILWLVTREYRALLAFGIVAVTWAGSVVAMHGFGPFIDYINQLQNLFMLPFGVSKYVNTTPLALLATALPLRFAPQIFIFSQVVLLFSIGALGWLAYRFRNASPDSKHVLLILAGLFPFIAFPHVLIYDLIALAPLLVLWSQVSPSRRVINVSILLYLSSLILPAISQLLGIALLGVLPLIILVEILVTNLKDMKPHLNTQSSP